MCSTCGAASTGARTSGFRSAVKGSCSIFRFRYLSRLVASNRAFRCPPECHVPLPYGLGHEGRHRHAQAPQKAAKCQWRTFEYSIGSGSDQPIAHHKARSEEHTSELQSPDHLVCRLLLEIKKAHV